MDLKYAFPHIAWERGKHDGKFKTPSQRHIHSFYLWIREKIISYSLIIVLLYNNENHSYYYLSMLVVRNLSIQYQGNQVLKNFELELAQGEIFALLGDSGSGKSSALRFIAGLDEAHNGSIVLDEKLLSDNGQHQIPPEQRGIGMVFQDYALFPHMSVEKNIAFGINTLSKNEQKSRVTELLSLVDLPNIEKKYPHQLSGGEQQRIALARALASNPKLLLLDESFSSLDQKHRETLANQVRDILKKTNTTAILVTHDKSEAEFFSDRYGVINNQQLQEK